MPLHAGQDLPGSAPKVSSPTHSVCVFTDPDEPAASSPIPTNLPLPESRDMQPVCRLRLAPAWLQPPEVPRARAATATTCQARRATTSRGCAWCVCASPRGATEPVEAQKDGPAVDRAEDEAGLAPEELEVLEEEAITGENEGRRPTDYDRRAHIFEESSRVFRELKHRSDGGNESDHGGVTTGATATETTACNNDQ